MKVVLTFDDRELQQFLKSWQEPAVKKTLNAAASSYGRVAKPILKAETPVAAPGNKYATKGQLRKLTRYRRFHPGHGIGVVIAAMGRGAFYRGWVVGGTKAHIIPPRSIGGKLKIAGGFASAVHHPGAKPNPYVDRAARRAESAGLAAAETTIYAGLDAKRVQETVDS